MYAFKYLHVYVCMYFGTCMRAPRLAGDKKPKHANNIRKTADTASCTPEPLVWQCVAMCCSVRQCDSVSCSVRQCVTVFYSVLQCAAVCYGAWQ